ncbi:MAG: hypothetical protein GY696_40405 [Gammaproteobacteria bacterium]|nr:hypothetical protein [Gammaproteobacteria bacterium]
MPISAVLNKELLLMLVLILLFVVFTSLFTISPAEMTTVLSCGRVRVEDTCLVESTSLLANIGCGSWLARIVALGFTVTAVPTVFTRPIFGAFDS